MNIPDKVKIGGLAYEVSTSDTLMRDNEASGNSCGNTQSIMIDQTVSKQLQETTFLHEVIHQISFVYNLKFDEHTTALLEAGLYAFIMDNPAVFSGNKDS